MSEHQHGDESVLHDDIARLCRAVGLFDGAQDRTPHEVMVRCIERIESGPSGEVVNSMMIGGGLSVLVLRGESQRRESE